MNIHRIITHHRQKVEITQMKIKWQMGKMWGNKEILVKEYKLSVIKVNEFWGSNVEYSDYS